MGHSRRWISILLISGAIIAILGLGLRGYTIISTVCGWNTEGDKEILHLYNALECGQTQEQVKAIFDAHNYKYLYLGDTSGQNWLVRTPIRWDEENWLLFIKFQTGVLCSVRIRYHDSSRAFPKDAPPDKETSDCPPDENLTIRWTY